MADGGASHCQGMDTHGPTAVINSIGKIDWVPHFCNVHNMKFHPTALKTREDLEKLASLIVTDFDYLSKHIQFNVIDKQVLIEAQKNPDENKDLIVRVAGYSDLFNNLDKVLQDEIIERTEQTF